MLDELDQRMQVVGAIAREPRCQSRLEARRRELPPAPRLDVGSAPVEMFYPHASLVPA